MSHSNEPLPSFDHQDEIPLLRQQTPDFTAERRAMTEFFDNYISLNQQPDGCVGKLTALQTETFLKVRDFVAGNMTHGLLQLACGYGKSAIATTTADALGVGMERADGNRRKALLGTSRNAIVRQFVSRNIQYGNEIGDEDDLEELLGDFGFFAPRVRPSMYNEFAKDIDGDVVVTPYQSLGNSIRNGIIVPGDFSVCLLDESQHLGQKRQQLLNTLGHYGLFIGLSATPGKSREFLPTVIDKVTMSDGVLKYGFLTDIKMHGIPTDCTFHSRGQANGDYLADDIQHLADDQARNALIVENIYTSVAEHGPGLVKCSRQLSGRDSHIQVIADMANQDAPYIVRGGTRRKLRVEAVSATIKGSADIIEEFVHGNTIDVLTFVDLIGEGFNMPRAKWGLWTPPTMSLNALEQFIGRGLRRDAADAEKVFHFLQLLDTNATTTDNALGWELFDLPRAITEATISRSTGVSYRASSPRGVGEPDRQHITVTDNVTAERIRALALDSTMRAPDIDGPLTSLNVIQETLDVDRDLLKRVLFDGGFTAYPQVIEDVATLSYPEAAMDYAQSAIAAPEDKTVRQLARRLHMEEGTVMRWIHVLEAPVTMLYPRSSKVARRQIHMKPAQRANFEQKLSANVAPLTPAEITLRDACERAEATLQTSRTRNFKMRGFTMEERKISVGRKPQLIGQRAELIPWITAYKNAQPAPATGYMPLVGLTRARFGAGKPTLEDIYIAASSLGLRATIFIRGGRERADYVEERHRDALIKKVNNVIRQRLMSLEDQSIPAPSMSGCIYGSDPSVAPDRTNSAARKSKKTTTKTNKQSDDLVPTDEVGNMDVVPVKLQRAVMSRHKAFQNLNPRDPTYREQSWNILQRLVRGVGTPLPPIPRNWIFLGDLADELNIPEPALVNLLVSKQISPSHACFIDFNGIRGLLGFCSPSLAATLRNKG